MAGAVPDRRTADLPNLGDEAGAREDVIARRAGFDSASTARNAEAAVNVPAGSGDGRRQDRDQPRGRGRP